MKKAETADERDEIIRAAIEYLRIGSQPKKKLRNSTDGFRARDRARDRGYDIREPVVCYRDGKYTFISEVSRPRPIRQAMLPSDEDLINMMDEALSELHKDRQG